MAHHAFFYAGDREAGITAALSYVEKDLGLDPVGNPDVITLRHVLFSVADSRALIERAVLAPMRGDQKVLIIAAYRFFHEAQNALLKLFEEPAPGTTLILIVPSEGNIITTLRSRLHPLPMGKEVQLAGIEEAFVRGGPAAREKVVSGILDEAKSDDDNEKLEARVKALRLAEGIAREGYASWRKSDGAAMRSFLSDLDRIIPVLNDRSAPLKPILEHLLIAAPNKFD